MHFLKSAAAGLTPAGEEHANVQSQLDAAEVVSQWEAIDFGNFQLSLEDQASQLLDMQERRLNQRKDLAEKTKATKDLLVPETTELVRMYQRSLEDVTAQAKFSANAFLTVFKMLRELPDPVTSLQGAEQQIASFHSRIKQLEEREESLVNALKASREKAKGAEELRAEREHYREEVQLDGAAKLEAERVAAQEKLAQAQAHFEEEMAKLQSQLDLALEEVERLKGLEVAPLQGESARLRARFNSADLNEARSDGYATAEQELAAKLEEAARLAENSSREYLSQIDELRATVSMQMEQIGDLRAELAKRAEPGEVNRLKAQLAILTRLTSENPQLEEGTEAASSLDGLESWLLTTNQRLVRELGQVKEELIRAKAELEQQSQQGPSVPAELVTPSQATEEEDSKTIVTLKHQRDRLRAVLEKRDLEIERLRDQLDEREQKARKVEDEVDKLRQRVVFLQSYKISERSTLLPSNVADPEASPFASLGRGVGHEFRALWESQKKAQLVEVVRSSLFGKTKDMRVIGFFVYFGLVHVWLLWLLVWQVPVLA